MAALDAGWTASRAGPGPRCSSGRSSCCWLWWVARVLDFRRGRGRREQDLVLHGTDISVDRWRGGRRREGTMKRNQVKSDGRVRAIGRDTDV